MPYTRIAHQLNTATRGRKLPLNGFADLVVGWLGFRMLQLLIEAVQTAGEFFGKASIGCGRQFQQRFLYFLWQFEGFNKST